MEKTTNAPGRGVENSLKSVEESLEKNFFGPMAGAERTHETKSTNKRALPWGPVLTLLILTVLLLGVFIAALAWPMAEPLSRPPPSNYYPGADLVGLIVTLALFTLLAWSYVATALTDPGRVPKQWPWDPSQADPRPEVQSSSFDLDLSKLESASATTPLTSRIRGLERKMDGRTRFCKKCNMYKPDRAHHCKKLGRCVLEMDHWCPWVRNTIGYKNRKFFFLAVMYGWITLFSYCVVLGPYLSPASKLQNALDFFIIFCWVLGAIECCLLLALWSFHVFLTVHAFTTIEFREKHLAKESKTVRSGDKVRELYRRSLYDVGVSESFKHLLGPSPLLWFLPTRYGMPNDSTAGAVFRVRQDHPLVQIASSLRKTPESQPPIDDESIKFAKSLARI